MIRNALPSDVPELVAMAQQFIAAYPLPVQSDAAYVEAALLALIDGDGVVLVSESNGRVGGMLIGQLAPLWFTPDVHMAVELAWWADPAARAAGAGLKLLRGFEDWARRTEAQVVILSDLIVEGKPTLGALAERLNYDPIERAHYKRIKEWQQPQQ